MGINWEREYEAYKALWDALQTLTVVPLGKKITKLAFTWTGDNPATIKFYDGIELLFTLTFTWNVSGKLDDVIRS